VVVRLRVWAIAALVAAGLSPAVADGAAKRIVTKPLLDSGVVQPGKDDGFSRTCPRSAPHPVGWQVDAQNPGAIAVDETDPFGRGLREWDLGVLGMSERPESYSVGPICLRAPGRFAYPTRSAALDPGAHGVWIITCPRRARHAVNGSLEPQTDADVGRVVMTTSTQVGPGSSPRRWAVGVRNVSTTAAGIWVGAVCMSAPARYVSRVSGALTLQPQQTDGGTGVCPARAPHPIAGTFYPVDDGGEGQFTLAQVALFGRRNISIQVTNRSAAPQRVVVGDVCIGDRHPARQRAPLRRVTAGSRPRISGST
jgi:hypothetical protein